VEEVFIDVICHLKARSTIFWLFSCNTSKNKTLLKIHVTFKTKCINLVILLFFLKKKKKKKKTVIDHQSMVIDYSTSEINFCEPKTPKSQPTVPLKA